MKPDSTKLPHRSYSVELEVRFVVSIILSVSMYFIAASIGSGWVLFLGASVLACAVLSILVPLFLLLNVKANLLAPETALEGESFQIRPQIASGNRFISENCKFLILSLVPLRKSLFCGSKSDQMPQNSKKQKSKEQHRSLQEAREVRSERHVDTDSKESEQIDRPRKSQRGVPQEVRSESFLVESIDTSPKFTMVSPALRRGKHKLPLLEICCSYPFGLAWVKATICSDKEIIVLPRTLSLEGNFVHRLKSSSFVPGDSHSINSGLASAASRGVRHYVRGDSRRNIHWNLSARHGQLMVKERENEGIPSFDIVFDAGDQWNDQDQFDLAITTAASLLKFGNNMGIHPELFILPRDYQHGSSLPDRIVELDQQLLKLACLDFPAPPQGKAIARDYANLLHRSKAVIIVSPSKELPPPEGQGFSQNSGTTAEGAIHRSPLSDGFRADSSNTSAVPGPASRSSNRVDPRSRSSLFLIEVLAQKQVKAKIRSRQDAGAPGIEPEPLGAPAESTAQTFGARGIEASFILNSEEDVCRL
jgi:hypothetical protein